MIEYSGDEPSGPMMDCEDEDRFQRFLVRERQRKAAAELTANEALKAAGFESVPNGLNNGTKSIRRISDGQIVARQVLARDVWEWLLLNCSSETNDGQEEEALRRGRIAGGEQE